MTTTRSDTPDQPARPSLLARIRNRRTVRSRLGEVINRIDMEDWSPAALDRLQQMLDGKDHR
jgi:hypothetical protein